MMSAGVLADDRIVDPSTLDRWENWFGESVNTSENAGGVWPDNADTDKWYYAEMQEATNSHTYDRISDESTGNSIEQWKQMLPIRDWEALEKEWSDANSGKNDAGEVVK